MNRIFTLILSALFAVAFTTAHAQTQEYVLLWTNGGNLSVKWLSGVDSLTFEEKPADVIINGHTFVDLGLPSGLLWAECNVGASIETGDGDYFAWGETETKSNYSWSTYKWGENLSKYNLSDDKNTLGAEDDAATVNWGQPCRMPSSSEFEELCSKCDWSWKSSFNNTSGYLVTGPNGNSIFFPASGNRHDDDLYQRSSVGYYWSRTLFTIDYNVEARCLSFDSAFVHSTKFSSNQRYYGYPVRPVANK